jgi:hypothetical protein
MKLVAALVVYISLIPGTLSLVEPCKEIWFTAAQPWSSTMVCFIYLKIKRRFYAVLLLK